MPSGVHTPKAIASNASVFSLYASQFKFKIKVYNRVEE